MIGIQVVSWAGKAPATPTTAWFGAQGGDIGRSAECSLALHDPERHISRRHAMVVERQGRYHLVSLSSGVPVMVNGAPLAVGAESALVAGMAIGIGAYMLQVLDEPESLGTGRAPARAQPAVPSSRPAAPPRAPAAPLAKTGIPPPAPEVDLLVGGTGPALPLPPPAPPQRAQAAPHAAAPAREAADLAAALRLGLGLTAGAIEPEQAARVGKLLRAMTEGTLQLLTARMIAKRELGAAATQLRTRENNPLKFSPDVDTALSHLLGPAERGFLDPLAAVQEAFDDLHAHQVALLAGMRAALDSVMSRFDPAKLEQRLAPGGAIENLIPANRRARLWSAYGEEYARIVGEIEDDFDALLGRAFLKAYQAQLHALAADRKRDDANP